MPTVVISGRVDQDTKLRADAVIRAAGSTIGNVINDVWETIAATGEIPPSPAHVDAQASKRATFSSFMDWFEALPPQNEAFAGMTDDEVLEGRVEDYA